MGKNKKVKNPNPMSNTKTMAREGMRIIRDIAYSKFNIYNDGHVFRNLDFTKATLAECDKRLLDAKIHVAAITYAYNGTTDPNVLMLLHKDRKTVEAYDLIHSILASILLSQGDTGYLLTLANKLPDYKYNI